MAGLSSPLFSIVFITANRCEYLLKAIESVSRLPSTPAYEIVVVDNGSVDNTVSQIRKNHPQTQLVRLSKNRGVAAGRNAGVDRSVGEFIVFVDDDAQLETLDALVKLEELFRSDQNLAIVAFRIINESTGTTLKHEFPMRDHSRENIDQEQPVSYFIGCGFAARRDVFRKSEGFFEEMVYGLEELDLSYRLMEARYKILYCPSIVVRHMAPPAVRRTGTWYYHLMRSRIILVLRNLPWWAAVPHLLIWHLGMLLHATRNRHLRGYLRGVADGWQLAPRALVTRRPISLSTARKVLKLSGRLFY